ncbi:MAG: 50S ribosomal protein L15 [Candidatus Aureabacteria bacterium]|nr:50S ribosomal protein L15 [Candidatus Auribacterota bacterium]
MRLDQVRNNPGGRKKTKRIGRGPGSGHGKTSCRGHKGQKARSGASIRPGFEGGQMPLIRRLPKRGFRSQKRNRMEPVNVESLNVFDEGSTVDRAALKARGLIKERDAGIKILGDGALTKRLTVVADAFSSSARKKIEEAKGRVVKPSSDRAIEPSRNGEAAKGEAAKGVKGEA